LRAIARSCSIKASCSGEAALNGAAAGTALIAALAVARFPNDMSRPPLGAEVDVTAKP
jgi:hypothetical protein